LETPRRRRHDSPGGTAVSPLAGHRRNSAVPLVVCPQYRMDWPSRLAAGGSGLDRIGRLVGIVHQSTFRRNISHHLVLVRHHSSLVARAGISTNRRSPRLPPHLRFVVAAARPRLGPGARDWWLGCHRAGLDAGRPHALSRHTRIGRSEKTSALLLSCPGPDQFRKIRRS